MTGMEVSARAAIIGGVTSAFILLLFVSATPAAQAPRKDSYVRNIQNTCAHKAAHTAMEPYL